eukprot:jgi/Antlo1/1999/1575
MKERELRKYFEEAGFYVGDGLKYGVDMLLYVDAPSKVHSKYAVLIDRRHTFLQIMAIQRVCTAARKTLVIAYKDSRGAMKLASVERFFNRQK